MCIETGFVQSLVESSNIFVSWRIDDGAHTYGCDIWVICRFADGDCFDVMGVQLITQLIMNAIEHTVYILIVCFAFLTTI